MPQLKLDKFFAYARERYALHLKKRSGAPPPWTEDRILQQYRFCNVFREDDKTTAWFRVNVRQPIGRDAATQVKAAITFRMLNRIDTGELLKDLFMPGQWDPKEAERRLRKRVREGYPITGPAYMILTPHGIDKVSGVLKVVEEPIACAQGLAKQMMNYHSIERATVLLQQYQFIGPFMAYEMTTDLRHTFVLEGASDLMSWANPGPGAAKGAARVAPWINADRGTKAGVADMLGVMREILLRSQEPEHWNPQWPAWEMRDVEHTLCEFDKYERVRLGQAKAMRRYP